MTELPRKAAVRTARLAALPLGYAGRTALGFGKRLGGRSAEAVLTEVQQRTAEQLFRMLGELKGGAMKFGQALSVLEAALPDELVAPYRAPPDRPPGLRAGDAGGDGLRGDRGRPRPGLARPAGRDGRDGGRGSVDRPGAPRPLARRPRGRGQGAVPRRGRRAARRPAADRAGGEGHGAGLPRHRHQAAGRRRSRRARPTSSTTASRPRPNRPSPTPSVATPRSWSPTSSRSASGAGQRVAGVALVAGLGHPRRHPGGARPLRRAVGPLPVRRPGPHRHAARRPAPGELPDHPDRRRLPGRLGVLDYGAVARLPERSLPPRSAG